MATELVDVKISERNLKTINYSLHDLSLEDQDMREMESAMEVLNEVDFGFKYSSEKLVNLDNLLMHLLACENEFESITMEDDNFSVDFISKALTLGFLHAILNTEVKEMETFTSKLQNLTIGVHDKIFSCEKSKELFDILGGKIHGYEESLRQSQERIMELKMQLTKLQMTSLTLNQSEWRYNTKSEYIQASGSGIHLRPHMLTVDKRHVLRMLEKSIATELDLEKKLYESKQNEEDLKLKLHLTEQVALCMEEAAEVTWGRFLEAENTVEVLTGISKEMVGRLQMVHFYLNGSNSREQDLKTKLNQCFEQLNAKELAISLGNTKITQLAVENLEVPSLMEKVTLLERKLKESESQLKEVNTCYESSREQIREMDAEIYSLKENVQASELRVREADSKIAQLTDTNMELTEELVFLKGNSDRNSEKVSLLEKQLRHSDLQLQQTKASSEANQELYSAIWDMETLIDELRQKLSKAEVRAENSEEQCRLLSVTNLELNKELDFMKARVEFLEMTLNHASVEKTSSAKDINNKSIVIMDMMMQLAIERDRIEKQFYLLNEKNKILTRKLQKEQKNGSAKSFQNGSIDDGGFRVSRPARDVTASDESEVMVPECSSRGSKVEHTYPISAIIIHMITLDCEIVSPCLEEI
ncbi:hypothetical protein Leryth_002180 [Lithospermum erythrorhizon]|nr:hypothetical protein Leryth_002180 [Lithospermum erythrorhizon]